MTRLKIKKGDTVMLLAGKNRNETGKVLKVLTKEGAVVVENLNLVKKHQRPKKAREKGSVVSIPMPVPVARVMVVCPKCGKPTRVGYSMQEETKMRKCKKCGQEFN